ncbi:hypothetical protein V8D89_003673 [Ganoderma adspersum]
MLLYTVVEEADGPQVSLFSAATPNSTTPDFRAVELNTLALDIIRDSALDAGDSIAELALSSLLFGGLTMLCLASIYFLVHRGSIARIHGRVILFSTVLLYLSTATYMGALIWAWSSGNRLISGATDGLFSPTYDGRDMAAFIHRVHQQSWMMTITLAVNILIGDAVVWWRVCVIWQHKVVNCIGLLLSGSIQSTELVFLIAQNGYAQASVVLSLSTNVLATSLVAYKAWVHRQLLKQHLASAGTTSQVLKALALLIESGCIYCVLLVFVIVYQTDTTPSGRAGLMFNKFGAYFTYGCLVPLVAIYPTIIIVLVALKRSPIDAGVRQAPGRSSEGGMSTAIEFHQSTFHSSTDSDMDTESAMDSEGVTADAHSGQWDTRVLKTATSQGEAKVVGNFA